MAKKKLKLKLHVRMFEGQQQGEERRKAIETVLKALAARRAKHRAKASAVPVTAM